MGCEKRATCQKPMHTRHQYATIALGRRTRKMRAVMKTLNMRASLRRSEQRRREVVGRNRNESGNTDGKPMDDKPFAEKGR